MMTPFKEISNMSMSDKVHKSQLDILDSQEVYNGSFNGIILELKEAIKSYLVKTWNTKKKKLFLHSAGYDSRIISGCLMELREERGEDWIGEIHFRCHQPEGAMFIEIMKRQGWREDQYSLWEDFKGKEDHYNLGRIEPVNGFMSHIQQYDFFSDYIEKHGAKNVVIIGGIYGGELFDYPSRGKKHFKDFKYCNNYWLNSLHNYMLYEGGTVSKYFDGCAYAIFPFLSYDYLRVASKMKKEWVKRDLSKGNKYPDNIRLALLKSFKVDLLNIEYGVHDYHWNTTQKTINKMRDFYNTSEFKKKYGIDIKFPFKNNTYEDKIWVFAVMYDYIFKK